MGRQAFMDYMKRKNRISRRVERAMSIRKPRTFVLERNKKNKLGIRMDRDLNIIKVESFAAKFGAEIGQKIIALNGRSVVTKKDVMRAMQKSGGSKAKQLKLTVLYVLFDIGSKICISLTHIY